MEEVVQDLSWRRCLPDCDWRMGTLTHCACGWSYCWVCGWSYRWAWPLGWKSESWMPYLWVIKSWMTDFTLLCRIYLNYNLIWKVLVALNSWVLSCGSSFLLIFSTKVHHTDGVHWSYMLHNQIKIRFSDLLIK